MESARSETTVPFCLCTKSNLRAAAPTSTAAAAALGMRMG
jgi:hypothetical protein